MTKIQELPDTPEIKGLAAEIVGFLALIGMPGSELIWNWETNHVCLMGAGKLWMPELDGPTREIENKLERLDEMVLRELDPNPTEVTDARPESEVRPEVSG